MDERLFGVVAPAIISGIPSGSDNRGRYIIR